MTGKLYVLAHTAPDAWQRLEAIMEECDGLATIVDIRSDTRAGHYPGWSQARLSRYWSFKYLYRGRSLAEAALHEPCGPQEGIPWLIAFLKRPRHVVLLCASVKGSTQIAAILKMMRAQLPEVEVY